MVLEAQKPARRARIHYVSAASSCKRWQRCHPKAPWSRPQVLNLAPNTCWRLKPSSSDLSYTLRGTPSLACRADHLHPPAWSIRATPLFAASLALSSWVPSSGSSCRPLADSPSVEASSFAQRLRSQSDRSQRFQPGVIYAFHFLSIAFLVARLSQEPRPRAERERNVRGVTFDKPRGLRLLSPQNRQRRQPRPRHPLHPLSRRPWRPYLLHPTVRRLLHPVGLASRDLVWLVPYWWG